MKTSLSITAALTLVSAASLSLGQQAPTARPAALPTFESALPAGTTVQARWETPADSTGASFVLAQTAHGTDLACVAATLVGNAWVIQSTDKLPTDDDPLTCLSAVRVNNRWAIARWNLGGSGDGASRVNESALDLDGLVNGRITRVWTGAVNGFALLPSGPQLSLWHISPGNEILEWSADGAHLAPRRAPARPAPARPAPARPTTPPARH